MNQKIKKIKKIASNTTFSQLLSQSHTQQFFSVLALTPHHENINISAVLVSVEPSFTLLRSFYYIIESSSIVKNKFYFIFFLVC